MVGQELLVVTAVLVQLVQGVVLAPVVLDQQGQQVVSPVHQSLMAVAVEAVHSQIRLHRSAEESVVQEVAEPLL